MKVEIELKLQSYCTHFVWYHRIISDSTHNFILLCCHYAQCFLHPIMHKIMLA